MLNSEQIKILILQFGTCRMAYGDGRFTEEDFAPIARWAGSALVNSAMLNLALSGEALIDIAEDGEIILRDTDEAVRLAQQKLSSR